MVDFVTGSARRSSAASWNARGRSGPATSAALTGWPGALESGQVWVNCYQACDSALPFGGYRESGRGRETCKETLDDYTELKTVVVSLGPAS